MPEQVIRVVTPIKVKWDGLSRRQQIQLVSISAIILLALILFLFFTFRTRWAVLYRDQDAFSLGAIAANLDDAGIRNRFGAAMTRLYVPERNVNDAYAVIMGTRSAASSHMPLADALDLTGLGTTEAERAAVLLHAQEARIEGILVQSQVDIIDAFVTITPAERNLMLRPNQPRASMAVTLTTTRAFTQSEGRSMAEHLRNMVLGLELENITIIDQRGYTIFSPRMLADEGGSMDLWNLRNQREHQIMDAATSAFMHLFDDVTLLMNVRYDDTIDETVRVMSRTAPVGTEQGLPTFLHTNSQEAEGIMAHNIGPGLGANMNATPAYMLGDPPHSSATARERIVSYVHDEMESIINRGPGDMIPEESSASFMAVLNTRIYQDEFMARDEERTIEDWWALMDSTQQTTLVTYGEDIEAIRLWVANATGIPNINVMIQEIITFVPTEETALPIATIIMLIVLALLLLLILIFILARRKEEEEEVEPELSVEDLLATTQIDEQKDEDQRLKDIEYETDNEIKKQIDKFVNEKPEAVAALLRNWLNAEEW